MDFLDHLVFLAILHKGLLTTYSAPDRLFGQGTASPEQVGQFLGVPLGPEELVSLVTGSPFFVPLEEPKLSASVENGVLVVVARDDAGPLSYSVRVDSEGRPEESTLHGEEAGKTGAMIRVEFDKYRVVNGVELPFRICVSDVRSGCFSVIQYSSLEVNPDLPDGDFRFTPPEDAEIAVIH